MTKETKRAEMRAWRIYGTSHKRTRWKLRPGERTRAVSPTRQRGKRRPSLARRANSIFTAGRQESDERHARTPRLVRLALGACPCALGIGIVLGAGSDPGPDHGDLGLGRLWRIFARRH